MDSVTASAPSRTRLWGGALVLARMGCAAVIALNVTVLVASIPAYIADLSLVCTTPCPIWRLSMTNVTALNEFGITVSSYVYGTLILNCVAVLAWLGAAGLILWRKSAYWDGLLLAMLLVTQGVSLVNSVSTPLYYQGGLWHAIIAFLSLASPLLFLATFTLFPDGRWAPRWMSWIFLLCCLAAGALLLTGSSFNVESVLSQRSPVSLTAFYLFVLVCGVTVQIYKFRVTLTTLERQQVKWVLLVVLLGIGLFAALIVPAVVFPGLVGNGSSYYLVIRPLGTIILLSAPICFAIAIFRYRLWDIDLLINRALVYGPLTGILALIYFGLVIGAQAVFQGFSGQEGEQPLVVVASTLLIAGLFQPLRRRLQRSIDRRFFRSKYDAQHLLATYSATLRQEVNLLNLRHHLLDVVEQTLHPTHVSLWLRQPPAPNTREAEQQPLA